MELINGFQETLIALTPLSALFSFKTIEDIATVLFSPRVWQQKAFASLRALHSGHLHEKKINYLVECLVKRKQGF